MICEIEGDLPGAKRCQTPDLFARGLSKAFIFYLTLVFFMAKINFTIF